MKADPATIKRIGHLRLMAFGSWLVAVVLLGLSVLARHHDWPFTGALLLGAAGLFGLLFAFHVIAMMATAVALMFKHRPGP